MYWVEKGWLLGRKHKMPIKRLKRYFLTILKSISELYTFEKALVLMVYFNLNWPAYWVSNPKIWSRPSGNLNLNIQSDERAIANLTESISTACRHCVYISRVVVVLSLFVCLSFLSLVTLISFHLFSLVVVLQIQLWW